jgi:hypothetical protein
MRTNGMLMVAALALSGCDRERRRNELCLDDTVLLATATGSPSRHTCSNKLHRARVQPMTLSGEKIGAIVFCECVDPTRVAPMPSASTEKDAPYPPPASAGQGDPQ